MSYYPKEIYKTIDENKRLKKQVEQLESGLTKEKVDPIIKIKTVEIIKDCDHLKVIHSLQGINNLAKTKINNEITKLEHYIHDFEEKQLDIIKNHIKQLKLI